MNARLSVLLVAGSAWVLATPSHPAMAAALETKEDRAAAVEVQAVRLEGSALSRVQVVLSLPGFKGVPALQVLERPDRIVLDLPDVLRGKQVASKDLSGLTHPLIKRWRLAQNQTEPRPVTRLVLEVERGTTAQFASAVEGVSLVLSAPGQTVVAAKEAPAVAIPAAVPAMNSVRMAELQPLVSMPTLGASYGTLPVLAATTLSPIPTAAPVPQEAPQAEAPRRGKTLGDTPSKYVGAPITIDMQKADLPSVLRVLAQTANLDIIHDSDLDGIKVEVNFRNRPWDQVLDLVCRQHGLGKTLDNGVLRVARLETLRKEEEMNRALEEARNNSGELVTWTRPLSFAKANDVRALVEKVKTPRGHLIVDERTNTLFITDLPRQKPLISDFINTLDVPIQQVSIEAKIVEANIGWNQAFGVKWPTANAGGTELTVDGKAAPWGSFNGPSWNSVNNRATGGTNSAAVAFSPGKEGVTSIAGAAGEMWLSFLSPRISLNVILQAAESEGNARIVSNPRVVTQNNKKGKMLSGERIPFPAMQAGGNLGAITVNWANANLSLEVTPQINNDGSIMMELKVEKSEADFSRQVNGQPTIIQREVETSVLVQDGGTAVLGGVYVKRSSTDTAGVPFMSKLPVIGALFRNRNNKEESRELLVFITPRIVRQ